jgi:ABC-type Fe3+/spermidine/putrescine transport system ATPase subunit
MNDLTREEDLNQLNQLLFKRQKKMDLVEANQEKAQAIKKNLQVQLDRKELNIKALSRHFPSPQTYRLLEKIKEIEALLKEIAELDQKTQKLFLVKLNLARQELGKVKKRKKINKLYNPDDLQREGFFIDYNK